MRVGPESAGANPGPASYRRGGPLAVTDANVMLGTHPAGVLPAGVRPAAPTSRWTATAWPRSSRRWPREVRAATGRETHARGAGRGLHARSPCRTWPTRSSASRWRAATTSRSYTLQCFGGAGGQHACAVADALGMTRVFVHPLAGVLSAYGMGLADQIAMREASVELPLDDAGAGRGRARAATQLGDAARDELAGAGRGRAARSRCARRAAPALRRAPTPRWRVPLRRRVGRDARARFEAALPAALRLPDAGPRAGHRGGVGRGRRRRRALSTRRPPPTRAAARAPRAGARACACYGGALARRGAVTCARTLRAGATDRRPGRSSPSATPPRWSSPAGRPTAHAPPATLELQRVRAARRRGTPSAPTPTR
ncbi:MAG: hypothetical protein MZW92_22750 [Comamonadaceae bacterium]|nr:hypothetical protein [Comamonadaceae bacterium]